MAATFSLFNTVSSLKVRVLYSLTYMMSNQVSFIVMADRVAVYVMEDRVDV